MRLFGVFGGVLVVLVAAALSSARPANAQLTSSEIGKIYVSTSSEGWIDGVAFDDEDIIVFDTSTATWSLFFDGSDVGLADDDLTGFHLVDATSELPTILLTVQRGLRIDGIGAVDDSDVLAFTPTALGSDTAGSFERTLDGSTVGLSTTSEDIDAVSMTPDGRLVISTIGSPRVPHSSGGDLSARDEDLLVLDDDGGFEWYFDGSDVGFGAGDTNAAWIDDVGESIALAGKEGIEVPDFTAIANDVGSFAGVFGPETSGVFSGLVDGGDRGLVGEQVDGLHLTQRVDDTPETTVAPASTTAPSTISPDTTTTLPETTVAPTTTTIVRPVADVSITIAGGADSADVSEPKDYRIEVANAGPATATDVVATTRLPQGVQLVSTTGCREDPNGGSCTLGDLPAGETTTFVVSVSTQTGATGSRTITTNVGSAVLDPDLADNAAEVTTQFVQRPVAFDDGVGDSLRTNTDTPLSGISLLANDDRGEPVATVTSFGGGDFGGSITQYEAGTTVERRAGSLTVAADGTFEFVPSAGFTGSVTFDYRLSNVVGSNDATVTIGVGPIPIPDREAIVYLSTSSSGVVGGIEFEDEDILAYDFVDDSWSLFFDGSDMDIGRRDLDAFHIVDTTDGLPSILLSLDNPLGLPGFGFVDDSDILRFEPTSLGETTEGTFELVLDGSTVGLESGSEDIDAITMTPEGQLLISTSGSVSIAGNGGAVLTAEESDVLSLGDGGGLAIAFDGAGFDQNITAAWLDPQTEHLHAAFRRGVSAQGLDGGNGDIFVFPFSATHAGPRLVGTLFDGDAHGLPQEQVDGITIHYRKRAASSAPPTIVSDGGDDTATITIAENTAPPGTLVWGSGTFAARQESLRSAEAVDPSGSVLTTGFFQGTIDVDPGGESLELTSAGGFDIFASKIDDAGQLVWAWSLGGSGNDRGAGISVDGLGNIFVTGYFQGTVDFDPGEAIVELTAAGVEDVFVAKFDTEGILLWARSFGGSDDTRGRGIAVDAQGDLVSVDDFVTDVEAVDGDGDTEDGGGLTYRFTTFSGGADNDEFEIDIQTGLIAFSATPDFESPRDSNRDNDYEVEVTVVDVRGLVDTQHLTIRVTDLAEDA